MAGRRARTLVVAPYFPDPPSWGAAMRVNQLTRQLALGSAVTFLGYGDGPAGCGPDGASALHDVCERVVLVRRPRARRLNRRAMQMSSLLRTAPFHSREVYTPVMQRTLDDVLRGDPFDVVQVEGSPMMSFRYRTDAALVLDEHNIESELLHRQAEGEHARTRRAFNRVEAGKYAEFETSIWGSVDACLVTSPREQPLVLDRAEGTRTAVVPNGVDPDFFAPTGDSVDGDSIVFTGLLSYRPNLEGVEWFVQEVLPRLRRLRPAVVLTVVGDGTAGERARLAGAGVTVTGRVPDIRPYLARAGCVVAPIRMGGGTRLKVLEALAMGKGIVSTTVGCEGIDVANGVHLMTADDAIGFADAVMSLLDAPALAERIGRSGRRLVNSDYSWARSGEMLREVHDTVMSHAKGAGLSPGAPRDRVVSAVDGG